MNVYFVEIFFHLQVIKRAGEGTKTKNEQRIL